ncbi:MAG: sensor domain-containing diguanylate cyclase [Alphaproteobacteria bacterium]|nr:sensor domain-containing diguanylate cyclase [Alphaproteobacteria bacterium]
MKRLPQKTPSATEPDFRTMVEGAHHGVFVHRNFRPLYANAAFAHLFGYTQPRDLLTLPLIRPLIPGESWALFEGRYDTLLHGKNPDNNKVMRQRLLRADGREIWLALTERRIVWEGQPAAEWHAFDIGEQLLLEQQLLASEQRLRAVLEVLPYPVLVARQDDGQMLFVNRKACLLLGESANALRKSKMYDYFARAEDRDDFISLLTAIKEVREQEIHLRAGNGRDFLAEVAAISIDYGGQQAVLLALNDISARKQLEAELFQQASTDPLTGISNRRYFIARGEQELRRARRFARPLSVMMLDLDHFKSVNDTYGHAGGDAVLQQMVQTAMRCLRNTDAIGRLGGEEFAVLMPETDLNAAVEVANRLRQTLADTAITYGEKTIRCTVSIGVAILQPADNDIDALLNRADQALYMAKQDGRNRVVGAE